MLNIKDGIKSPFCALVVLFLHGFASATVYVVDNSHPQASDTNPGMVSSPFKTITHAANSAVAGDTIVVKAGTYRGEAIMARNSGTRWARITLRAAEGEQVVVKGSEIITDWVHHAGHIWKHENWPHVSQQVFIDGKPLQQIGFNNQELVDSGNYVPVGQGVADMIPGSFYYNTTDKTLYIWPRAGINSQQNWWYWAHEIEASVTPVLFSAHPHNSYRADGWTIRGITWEHSNNSAAHWWPAIFLQGRGIIFEDNIVRYMDFGGVGVFQQDNIVRNNIIEWCGNNGLYATGTNQLIKSNVIRFNNYRGFNPLWHAGGMKNPRITNSTISHNHVHDNYGFGIWIDIDCDGIIIENNLVHDHPMVGAAGIMYEISYRGTIRDNLVFNSARGIWVCASDETLVAGNTIYDCKEGIVVADTRGTYTLNDNRVERNTVVESRSRELVLQHGPGAQGNSSDHNVFFRNNGEFIAGLSWGDFYSGLQSWRGTGNDLHSFYENPGITYAKDGPQFSGRLDYGIHLDRMHSPGPLSRMYAIGTTYMASSELHPTSAELLWYTETGDGRLIQGADANNGEWPARALWFSENTQSYEAVYRVAKANHVFRAFEICLVHAAAENPTDAESLIAYAYDESGQAQILEPGFWSLTGENGIWRTYMGFYQIPDGFLAERLVVKVQRGNLVEMALISSVLFDVRYTASDCTDAINMGVNPLGDINNDCVVDINDFAIFANQWLDFVEFY